jgi:MoaA/NifB/PqqE/SkfB family radical SAM enzyme
LAERAFAEKLQRAGLDHVQITLESARREVHNAMTAAESFEETVRGIENSLSAGLHSITNTTLTRRNVNQAGEIVEVGVETNGAVDDGEARPRIVRTKEFQVKPMFSDEAVEQMELLGHDFFVFRDAENSQINVLYRREDGNYGLIVPGDAEE